MTTYKKHTVRLEGRELNFEIRDNMVDVTFLGLPFGANKNPAVWLQTREASAVAAIVAMIRRCKPEDLVYIEGEGEDVRVWLDLRLALCYAGWLFPPFRQWCADKIGAIEERLVQRQCEQCEHREQCEDQDKPDGILIAIRHPDDLPC